jgi:ABC-type transport system involved in multi-copper enzyme maturation permease subunit
VIGLAVVELRRFVSRRLVQVLVLLLLLAIAVTGVIVAVNSKPPSAAAYADARMQRTLNVRACADHPRRYGVEPGPGETSEAACERAMGPLSGWASDERFDLSGLRDIFLGTSFVVSALGLVIGASFIGAEWHWGTIGTLLTWEPRRTRVLLVKLLACMAATFALFLAIQAVLGLVLWLVAATRGITEGTGSASWFRSVAGVVVRSAALGAFSAAVGVAIATVGRNTAAALGVGFVYFGVVEGLIRGLRPAWQRWLVGDNATLFLTGIDNRFPPLGRTMTSSGLLLLAYAAGLIAIALAWFRARDLT